MDSSNDTHDHSRDVQAPSQASTATAGFDAFDATAFDNRSAPWPRTPIALSGPVCCSMQPGQTLQAVASAPRCAN